jgi:hypothetical protein
MSPLCARVCVLRYADLVPLNKKLLLFLNVADNFLIDLQHLRSDV